MSFFSLFSYNLEIKQLTVNIMDRLGDDEKND